jgi:hydrophobe/amphiphile efflux-3 (HAE3) family protein
MSESTAGPSDVPRTRAERIFWTLTARPWTVVALTLLFIGLGAAFLPRLERDTSADAFIADDHPAVVYRDSVEEIFGLEDPIVTAVVDESSEGVYRPETLELVRWLTDGIRDLENVDPERVTSLATESHIVGTRDGMIVEEFLEEGADEHFTAPLGTGERAAQVRRAIDEFPLYQGLLVARDGTATVVVAELVDPERSTETYDRIRALAERAPVPDSARVHVAGEGAVAGYLSTYIDQDARRLNPVAALVVTVILALAFLSVRGAVLPNVIVLGTAAATFGAMAALGVEFFVITNGLVVNLIAIAVADSIHVFSQYFEELRADPEAGSRVLAVRSLGEMWRPVTLTTLTTMAGFLGLAFSTTMPPIRFFGIFGALGVAAAWALTMTFLPAALTLWPGNRLPRPFRRDGEGATAALGDVPARVMERVGRAVLARPKAAVGLAAAVAVVGLAGASRLEVNDARIENFQESEPIYRADKAINRHMDGTYHLDVMVETPGREDLYRPEHLRRIQRLQDFLEGLPHVNGTSSVADYVKQMHRAVNENREEAYRIPDDPRLISQLFFLYDASGDPTDFEEEIDYARRRALVRARVDQGEYRTNRVIVPATERYLETEFDSAGIQGTVTGRVKVDYHWIEGIATSHPLSVALSFGAVLLTAILLFRSVTAGLFAALPVGTAVLLIYAVMGFGGIELAVGTSMFAAIAIGLGVDFAIHTVDRLRELVSRRGFTDTALLALFPSTGRALLFNFLAIALGFGVLLTSDVPPLLEFGGLVGVAVSASFLAAMTVLPALAKLTRPAFLTELTEEATMRDGETHDRDEESHDRGEIRVPAGAGSGEESRGVPGRRAGRAGAGLLALLLAAGAPATAQSPDRAEAGTSPADLPAGREVMERVDARDDGEKVARSFTLELTDRSGTTRVQEVTSFRKYFGEEKRTILFYTDPANIRGTGFLTYDYADPSVDDDQWLYLPALRKIRRISASDRGDYFLGTDFTYEEIKKEQKVELSDYRFETMGTATVDGVECIVVRGTPVSESVAEELGYGRVKWRIDPEMWMPRLSDYWDTNGNHLKTIHTRTIERIDGIWTAMEIHVRNHKTGHRTLLTYGEVDYEASVPDRLFEQARLRRGL